MNTRPEPRTGRELLARDMIVRAAADVDAVRERLQPLYPALAARLDGTTNLFALWQEQRQEDRDMAAAAARLKNAQTELAAGHADKLRRLLETLREMEQAGMVQIRYSHRVRPGDVQTLLEQAGVAGGDVIFVHSKLGGLGYVEHGIDGIIAELRAAVDPEGTLAMPTFSQNYMGMVEEPYNKGTSVSTVGRITEAFRLLPGVRRSDNPCHSIAAIGAQAEYLTASYGNLEIFAREGPFGKLYDLDAWIIMLGCSLGANTTLHAVEAWALPYLPPIFLYADDGNGGIRRVVCKRFPNWCREWYGKNEAGLIQQRLFARGTVSKYELGRGMVYTMRARRLVDDCLRILKAEPEILLCQDPKCRTCPCCRAMLVDWQVPDAIPATGVV